MKYKLGEKHPTENLYRVVALKDFGNVKAGDIGGWVESEHNLSQEGDCWVYGDAYVCDDAQVYGEESGPAKREWVGLTDEERYLGDARPEEEIEYAKAIEAKLKEKNT
jgi:hypothetical protein